MTNDKTDISQWSFSSGRVVALESQMARREFYDRLLKAKGAGELISGLGGSLLSDVEISPQELKDAESKIAGFYRSLMEEIRDNSPYGDVADLLLWKRELRSFRNFVKRDFLDVSVSKPDSDYSNEFWREVFDGTGTDVPEVFDYVASRTRRAAGGQRADPALFDAAFDSAMLSALRGAAYRSGSDFISGYWDRYDTIKGVEFLWRAGMLSMPDELRSMLIEERAEKDFMRELEELPTREWTEALNSQLSGLDFDYENSGGKNGVGMLRGFVDAADRWLMEYTREAKLVAFGPERIFGALAGLESEAYNMSVVLVGRANAMSAELLARHLRAGYV